MAKLSLEEPEQAVLVVGPDISLNPVLAHSLERRYLHLRYGPLAFLGRARLRDHLDIAAAVTVVGLHVQLVEREVLLRVVPAQPLEELLAIALVPNLRQGVDELLQLQ